MLCCVVCCVVLCCAVLCCAVLCCVVRCCAVLGVGCCVGYGLCVLGLVVFDSSPPVHIPGPALGGGSVAATVELIASQFRLQPVRSFVIDAVISQVALMGAGSSGGSSEAVVRAPSVTCRERDRDRDRERESVCMCLSNS